MLQALDEEKVLQALDEFAKMRPSKIPTELDEYLCWVAKTGDPVYQWSLVKPLFREKLTRVMENFNKSCPSLQPAPCPNVEPFNYDVMKCNLLELLESFANAPFTVQRICELLVSPWKEYNRVDKFMRAIEKNILVVSTREPDHPATRRGENGEGMVNGSADETVAPSQASHEVEMESWVKDCAVEAAVAVPVEDEGVPLLDSVIAPAAKVAKVDGTSNDSSAMITDKSEEAGVRLDVTNSTLPVLCPDIVAGSPNLPLPVQSENPTVCEVENLSGNEAEPAAAASETPDAVMNEDTSSQPSLDSEADDEESSSSRKLQTTFQTKDFVKVDAKPSKFYADSAKEETERSPLLEPGVQADTIADTVISDDSTEKSVAESKLGFECQESVIPIVESLLEKRPREESEMTDLDTGESRQAEDDGISPSKKSCIVTAAFLATSVDIKTADAALDTVSDQTEDSATTSCAERLSGCENVKLDVDEQSKESAAEPVEDSLPEVERTADVPESSRPIVEEPSFEESSEDSRSKSPQRGPEQTESSVTIEEAMDDDTRINRSIVPDPIPIIEEPKDTIDPSSKDTETATIIEELPIEAPTEPVAVVPPTDVVTPLATIVELAPTIESIVDKVVEPQPIGQEDITDLRNSPAATDVEKVEPAESMEVDGEESMQTFQQDEPMEQEPGDLLKS